MAKLLTLCALFWTALHSTALSAGTPTSDQILATMASSSVTPSSVAIVRADDTFTRLSRFGQRIGEKNGYKIKVAIAFTYGEELSYYDDALKECEPPGKIVASNSAEVVGHYKSYALGLLNALDTSQIESADLAKWLQDFSATGADLAAYLSQREVSICSTETFTQMYDATHYVQFVYIDDQLAFIVSAAYFK
jgi:hypothetical protein